MPRIIEEVSEDEFDDDTDLPLPSRPLPDNNGKGPLLMEIGEADDYIPVQNAQTSAPARGASSSSTPSAQPTQSPADMEENSNTPSNGGLSSPMRKREPWYVSLRTLSCVTLERKLIYSSVWKRVMTSGVARLGRCGQRKGMQL